MKLLQGEGVSPGLAGGTVHILRRSSATPCRRTIANPEAEVARFYDALRTAAAQLEQLYRSAAATLGEADAALFRSHRAMLEDPDYCAAVSARIRTESINGEYAVYQAARQLARTFEGMESDYMRARAADVLDISRRLMDILMGAQGDSLSVTGPCILAADDLVPSETARLDKTAVLAFLTASGSRNSHSAIFARTLGIPAVVNLGDALYTLHDGDCVYADGGSGEVFVNPDAQTTARLLLRKAEQQQRRARLERYRDCPILTASGRRLQLCANIGSPADLPAALSGNADGIGLFRSEFVYLGHSSFPGEDEQYRVYRRAVEAMEGKPVVIRTLDVGADKQADYLGLPREENPALGLRAIRFSLARPQVFATQLRAIYRASAHGNVSILLPLISSLWEVQQAKALAARVRADLAADGIPFAENVPVGIMIETPAAALTSDLLAPEVDFFSIGTNDLTQYTLAADRQSQALAPYCDGHHEAILRLLRMAVENAHRAHIPVAVCGELAADPTLTDFFLTLDVDMLSMSPGSLAEFRAAALARG